MSYTINSIEQSIKPGMITGYFGSSTNDPPGWVIANGVARTTSDIYDNLVNLSIGSLDVNNKYVPPNLNGAFLRGTGTSNINNIYVGPSLKSYHHSKFVTHTHDASQNAHTHPIKAVLHGDEYDITGGGRTIPSGTTTTPVFGFVAQNGYNTIDGYDNQGTQLNMVDRFELIIANATPAITFTSGIVGGKGNANETRPYNVSTAWIIKL